MEPEDNRIAVWKKKRLWFCLCTPVRDLKLPVREPSRIVKQASTCRS